MLKKLFLSFSFCLFTLNLCGQIKAVTETGDEVILYSDNTWNYVNDSLSIKKEIKTNEVPFIKDKNSKFLVKSKKIGIGLWINPKKWSFERSSSNDATEFTFTLRNEDLYGMLIVEKTEIPLLSLKEIALSNAKEVASNVKVEKEEFRTVNGIKLLMMQLSGVTQGIKFKYYAYYYSSKKGVVQLVTYSSENLFDEYNRDMDVFINGFVEIEN